MPWWDEPGKELFICQYWKWRIIKRLGESKESHKCACKMALWSNTPWNFPVEMVFFKMSNSPYSYVSLMSGIVFVKWIQTKLFCSLSICRILNDNASWTSNFFKYISGLKLIFKRYIDYRHAEKRSCAIKRITILILFCFVKSYVLGLSGLFIFKQIHWSFRSVVFWPCHC